MVLTPRQASFLLNPPPFRGRVAVLQQTVGTKSHIVALHGEIHRFSAAHHVKRQCIFQSKNFPVLGIEQADPTVGIVGRLLHRLTSAQPFDRMPWRQPIHDKTVYALEHGLQPNTAHHISEAVRYGSIVCLSLPIGNWGLPFIPFPPSWLLMLSGLFLAQHIIGTFIPHHLCRLPTALRVFANPFDADSIGREQQQAKNIDRIVTEDSPPFLNCLMGTMHVPGTSRLLQSQYGFETVERSTLIAVAQAQAAE